jgi:hypothetical protein
MKNSTKIRAGALGLTAAVILGGCKMESDDPTPKPQPQDPVCECEEKSHFLPCDCPVKGTDKCDCTIKPRGVITLDGVNIPVYQTAGVEDANIDADISNVITGYNGVANTNDGYKTILKDKIKAVRIVTTENTYMPVDGGQYIIEIKTGISSVDAKGLIGFWVATDKFTQIKSSIRNGIRLADGNGVPAKHLASPAPQFGKRKTFRIQNRIAMARVKSSRQYC